MLIGAESIATESNELIGLLRLFSLSSHQVGVGKRPMSERKKVQEKKIQVLFPTREGCAVPWSLNKCK